MIRQSASRGDSAASSGCGLATERDLGAGLGFGRAPHFGIGSAGRRSSVVHSECSAAEVQRQHQGTL